MPSPKEIEAIKLTIAQYASTYVNRYIKPMVVAHGCPDIDTLTNNIINCCSFAIIGCYIRLPDRGTYPNKDLRKLTLLCAPLTNNLPKATTAAQEANEPMPIRLPPSKATLTRIRGMIQIDPNTFDQRVKNSGTKYNRFQFCFDPTVMTNIFDKVVFPYIQEHIDHISEKTDSNSTTHPTVWHRFQDQVANNRCSVPAAVLTFTLSFAAMTLMASGIFTLPTLALTITCYALAGIAIAGASAVITADCIPDGSRLTA